MSIDTSAEAVERLAKEVQTIRWPLDEGCRLREDAADALARALEQARAEEREACARIAKRIGTHTDPHYGPTTNGLAMEIESAIRARGKEVGGE